MTGDDPVRSGLAKADRALRGLSLVPRGARDEAWRSSVDGWLRERFALMAERDRGFRVSDRRKVRP